MAQLLSPPAVENGFVNPRAATNLNGWVASGANVTIAQLATDGYQGATCVDVTLTSGTQAAVVAGSPATTYGVAVLPGQVVFVRCAVKHVAAPGAAQYALSVSYYNAAGVTLATRNVHSPLSSRMPGGVWSTVDGFDVAPVSAAFVQATVTLTSSAGAAEFRVADMQITPDQQNTGVPAVVFGDRPGCAWTGTAHASASVGPSGFVNLVAAPQTAQTVSGTFGVGQVNQIVAPVVVFGGQEYTATVTGTLTSVPVGAKAFLRLSWLDSAGTVLNESSQGDVQITAGVPVSVTKAAPPSAYQARIDVVVDTAGAYSMSFASNSLVADSGAAPSRGFSSGFNDNSVSAGALTAGQDVLAHQLAGSRVVRFGMPADEAQPTAASAVRWDGTRWAQLLSQVRAAGLKAIPLIGAAPAWMSGVASTAASAVTVPAGAQGTSLGTIPLVSTAGFSASGWAVAVAQSGMPVTVQYSGVSGGALTGVVTSFVYQADTIAAGAPVGQLPYMAGLSSQYAAAAAVWAPLVAEFQDVILAVEVGNEPNLAGSFAQSGVDAAHYTAWLQAAYGAVKGAAPQVPVLCGGLNQYSPGNAGSGSDATGMDPGSFLAAMYAAGAKGYMDGVAVHPYSSTLGTGAPPAADTNGFHAGFWPTVDKMRAQIAAAGDQVPLWVTEFGVRQSEVSLAEQATMVRWWWGLLRRQPDVRCALVHTLQDAAAFGAQTAVAGQLPLFQALQAAFTRAPVGYFDGSTGGASWSGTANASASVLPTYQTVPLTGQEGSVAALAGRLQPGVRPALVRPSVTLAGSPVAASASRLTSPVAKVAQTVLLGTSIKQARPVRLASAVTHATVTAGKLVGGIVLAAAVTCVAQITKRTGAVRTGATAVIGSVKRAMSMLRQAVTALIGFFLPGATPATATVAFTRATYVNVTIGPL